MQDLGQRLVISVEREVPGVQVIEKLVYCPGNGESFLVNLWLLLLGG